MKNLLRGDFFISLLVVLLVSDQMTDAATICGRAGRAALFLCGSIGPTSEISERGSTRIPPAP
jgi:hypothetical protein